jgi:hypothetical protein
MSIIVEPATTPAEITAARELRYRVFYEELGDERYADHEARQWGDEADAWAHVLNARRAQSPELIGTLRLELSTMHRVRHLDRDNIPIVAAHVGTTTAELAGNLAKITRGCVAAVNRGSGVFSTLLTAAEASARETGSLVIYGAVAVGNTTGHHLLQRRGYQLGPRASDAFAARILFLPLRAISS